MRPLDLFRNVSDRLRRTRRAYHTVFGSTEGAIVLHDLLARTGALETSMTGGDPYMTAFKEGRRSVGLDLMHALRWTEAETMELAMRRTGEQLAAMTETE